MNAKEFMEKLAGDKDLQEKLKEEIAGKKPQSNEERWAVLSEFATKSGYEVDPMEFAIAEREEDEVDEKELTKVAGGGTCYFNDFCYTIINNCLFSQECWADTVCDSDVMTSQD